jgi:outer membrane lipoprotein SlyB
MGVLLAAALGAAACSTGNPEEDHELACAGGALTGAVVGGLIGNQFGGGSGRAAMTALGTGAGVYAGQRLSC